MSVKYGIEFKSKEKSKSLIYRYQPSDSQALNMSREFVSESGEKKCQVRIVDLNDGEGCRLQACAGCGGGFYLISKYTYNAVKDVLVLDERYFKHASRADCIYGDFRLNAEDYGKAKNCDLGRNAYKWNHENIAMFFGRN